jgi:hypothetical protein
MFMRPRTAFVTAIMSTRHRHPYPEIHCDFYARVTESGYALDRSGSIESLRKLGSAKRCGKLAVQFLTFERILRDIAGLDEDSQFRPLRVYSLSEADARRVFLSEADKRQESTRHMRIYSKYLPGTRWCHRASEAAAG